MQSNFCFVPVIRFSFNARAKRLFLLLNIKAKLQNNILNFILKRLII
jgi:hypothetical protein